MRINTDLFGLRSNTDPKPKEIPARWNRPRAESVAWKKFRAAGEEGGHLKSIARVHPWQIPEFDFFDFHVGRLIAFPRGYPGAGATVVEAI
jgi:hypothetical protein